LFRGLLGLTVVLTANSAYLLAITAIEEATGHSYQNFFYQYMFLGHLVLGLLLLVPFLVFAVAHVRNTANRPNRRAVPAGYALLAICLVVLGSGLALMRVEGFELRDPRMRSVAYWAHVLTPALAV